MKAKKLPSGRWRCQIYLGKDENGKVIRESVTADTRKAAEFAANLRLNEYQGINDRLTVKDAVKSYIRLKESVLSPSTIRSYESLANNHFQVIGKMDLTRLTSADIQREINHISASGVSAKTVKNINGLLTATLKTYRPGFAASVRLPERKIKEPNIPTDRDVKQLLSALHGHYLELAVMLAAFGPMRRGEICALRTENIDGRVVHVCENMVQNSDNEWVVKSPKTAAGNRFIEYPDFVAELWKGKKGRIFDVTPNKLTKDFRAFLIDNGLPVFRFHDLRHYSASIQHALGVPDAYIIQRGGWQTDATLKAVYRHALKDKQREMTEKVNAYFSGMTAHDNAHGKEKALNTQGF